MFRLGSEREVAFLDREEHFMHFLVWWLPQHRWDTPSTRQRDFPMAFPLRWRGIRRRPLRTVLPTTS